MLCKFWFHITKDEQLDRFKAREGVAYKRWKLTDEDWRNREKWDAYEVAVDDMIEHTSTTLAPWTLVEANDKRFARIKVLTTVCERLRRRHRSRRGGGDQGAAGWTNWRRPDDRNAWPGGSRRRADDEGLQAYVAVATELTDDDRRRPRSARAETAVAEAPAMAAPSSRCTGRPKAASTCVARSCTSTAS